VGLTPHFREDAVNRAAPLRYLAAALLLLGGLVHLKLYLEGYRDFPDENLGRSFLLNIVLSVVLAIAVAVRREAWIRIAGIVLSGATLVAFLLSRTNRGIFGLTEEGLEPAPEAVLALIAAIGSIVVLVVLLLVDRAPARDQAAEPPRTALAIGAGVVILTAVLGVLWNQDGTTSAAAEPPGTTAAAGTPEGSGSSVTISDFTFFPGELTVPAGTEVTWTNNDGIAHSVVAEDGSFKSEPLDSGATFKATLSTPGTYAYLCGIHSSMRATVIVT
jgi:plastocyanin